LTDHPEPTSTTHLDTLSCLECGRSWLDGSERWRLYLTAADPAEPLLYCTVCAAREFDD